MKYKTRLEQIRDALWQERDISYDDIIFLQNHLEEVKALGDVRVAEWEGLDESEWYY